jgi:hypothetical protein
LYGTTDVSTPDSLASSASAVAAHVTGRTGGLPRIHAIRRHLQEASAPDLEFGEGRGIADVNARVFPGGTVENDSAAVDAAAVQIGRADNAGRKRKTVSTVSRSLVHFLHDQVRLQR